MPGERFEIEPEESYREPRKGSGCLRGCLIVLAIFVALAVIFGVVASFKWRGWVASVATIAIEQSLDASNLPAQEKIEVQQELNRVIDAFQAKQISGPQLEEIMTALVESPLLNTLVVSVIEAQYLDKSGLDAEEIAAGQMTLRRFVSGVLEDKIKEEDIDGVMSHIATRQPDGTWVFREQVSDEDLRAMLAAAKADADAAEIPEDVEEVDPSEEVRRIVDGVLGEQAQDGQ
ncbi:hypothetical protein [Bythopirellula polymerisocia]|uniref:Uncharacterized protein n=1 Tax=Bythopirellula polymerisocia TaxID=2528003 RepID=A0A5C6CQE4_9BACT|nr:hypothetical protein [Bythopirellula polymerisocia]TWU25641.1 hypothetical protein Pla144_28490 [Bythopirellula polymerisocia]